MERPAADSLSTQRAMMSETPVDTAIRAMLGSQCITVSPVSGGGNSALFRIDSASKRYALKKYPLETCDPRRRQATEKTALQFLAACNIDCVPKFHATFENYSLFSWIDGDALSVACDADIEGAAEITIAMQRCSAYTAAAVLSPAYEACISLRDLIKQLQARRKRLADACAEDPTLRAFIDDELDTALALAASRAHLIYQNHDLSEEALAPEDRRLIHGDFGLHNMLKSTNGQLFLLDFEYFGWDDPVKMIADFALHPGAPLSTAQRARFLDRMTSFIPDKQFCFRLHALLPLFAIRWACIACNAFLPERRVRMSTAEWQSIKEQQLLKARSLLKLCALEGLL